MDRVQLLREVEDLIQTAPGPLWVRTPLTEQLPWFGRAAAVVEAWDYLKSMEFFAARSAMDSPLEALRRTGLPKIMELLHHARTALQWETGAPTSIVTTPGMVYSYFEGLRSLIQSASADLFFVDPYLDAEFLQRYGPYFKPGVQVRLLMRNKPQALLQALTLFCTENPTVSLSLRHDGTLHDRYVFIDRRECHQSGASFKDGARTAATLVSQITDAFAAVQSVYEGLWASATVYRP